MRNRQNQFAAFLFACGALVPGLAGQVDERDKRIQELEARVNDLEGVTSEMEEKVGSRSLLHSFSASSLDFGGHLTSVWTSVDGESSSDTGHVATFFELFVRAEIDEKTSLFATPGFYIFTPPNYANTQSPALTGESSQLNNMIMARAYVEHQHSSQLGVQLGIIGTPHGVTNREYFLNSRLLMSSNLHTRNFLENQLYAQRLIGGKLSGTSLLSSTRLLEYDFYVGVENEDPNEAEYGARFGLQFIDMGMTVSANFGGGSRESFTDLNGLPIAANVPTLFSPFPATSNVRTDYEFFGVDVDLRTKDFGLRAEAYRSSETNDQNREAFSASPAWWVRPDVALSYRFDYFNSGMNLGFATEHTLGVAYDYTPHARIRLDFSHQELPNSPNSIDFALFSFSVSF